MAEVNTRVLVVDDHRDIREPLIAYLRANGMEAIGADSAESAARLLRSKHPDLVVLDIMLPGQDGLSFCRTLRSQNGLPVIFLSARGEDVDRIVGLEMGADDYVTKPFAPRELLARIHAVMRRVRELPPEARLPKSRSYRFAEWTLNAAARELTRNDGLVVSLSATEFRLLTTLLDAPQVVFTRDQLLDRIRGRGNDEVFDRSIDTQISRLRRKVERDAREPRIIKTAWGSGYVLACDVELT